MPYFVDIHLKKNKYGSIFHSELSDIEAKLKIKGIPATTSLMFDKDNDCSKKIKDLCKLLQVLSKDFIDPKACNLIVPNSYTEKRYEQILSMIDFKYGTNFSSNNEFSLTMNSIIQLKPILDANTFQTRLEKLIKAYTFYEDQLTLVKNGALPSSIITNIITFIIQNDYGYDAVKEVLDYAYSFSKASEENYESEDEEENEYLNIVNSMNAFLCSIQKDENKNCVRLLTAHQSKGLQFDVVFVVGLESGSFPSNVETLTDHNLDNERRLFYVCVTRARELLYLTSTGYSIDYSLDLADKSFIYTVPDSFFSTKVENFDNIKFTISDSEKIQSIKEKNIIIDNLESDIFIYHNKLMEASKKLEDFEKISSNLSLNLKENSELKKNIKIYKEKILKLKNESLEKNNYLDSLIHEINVYKQNENLYRQQINVLNETNTTSEKEKDELLKELNKNNQHLKYVNKKYLNLLKEINEEKERTKHFEKQLEMQVANKDRNEIINTVQEEIKKIDNNFKGINIAKNNIDCIFSILINYDNEKMNDETKKCIKKIFKVLIVENKYPHLRAFFEMGLSSLQNLIECTSEYLNEKCDKALYRSKLRAFNYKGNLDTLVKNILIVITGYSDNKDSFDFNICRFLNVYLNYDIGFGKDYKYTKLVNNYKKSKNNINFELGLLEEMFILNAITTTCNHEQKSTIEKIHVVYRKTVEEFLNKPSRDYYSIFSSFFRFIALFIDKDDLMIFVRRLWI